MRAEKDSASEKSPRDHGPAAGDLNPLLARIAHDQRGQRERKWNRESDVAQVQHGRMNHHLRILQQRVEAVAVGG